MYLMEGRDLATPPPVIENLYGPAHILPSPPPPYTHIPHPHTGQR